MNRCKSVRFESGMPGPRMEKLTKRVYLSLAEGLCVVSKVWPDSAPAFTGTVDKDRAGQWEAIKRAGAAGRTCWVFPSALEAAKYLATLPMPGRSPPGPTNN